MTKTPHDVVTSRDRDGTSVVGVKLSNRDARAWLRLDDYHHLLSLGATGAWSAGHGTGPSAYVRTWMEDARRIVTVSRLIAGPKAKNVSYHDRDYLNLRRANLKYKSHKDREIAQ